MQWLKRVFNRLNIILLLALAQAVILIYAIQSLSSGDSFLYLAFGGISVVVAFVVLSRPIHPSYKLAFIVPILLFPIFGGLLYMIFGWQGGSRRFRRRVGRSNETAVACLRNETAVACSRNEIDVACSLTASVSSEPQSEYLNRSSGYPAYERTHTTYISSGEAMYRSLLQALKRAEHFIFMEYFIIEDGEMWRRILQVLESKAQLGLDVRLLFDDFGCISKLPYRYEETLRKRGIQCQVFNPIRPMLDVRANYRDHRKITVIDGHTGFTGGINLADEYINAVEKHGHWKDAGVRLHGDAVWSLTVMFLQNWHFGTGSWEDVEPFRPWAHHAGAFSSNGLVQPFGDSPGDSENVGEGAYMNLISRARRYVWITTPYLVIDNALQAALQLASRSGIDVRIITPGRADKWYVHPVTRSYYQPLVEAGVRIYEYTPGFIHSKVVIADDEVAIVGTINLDFRSLYLHFECATWMFQTDCLHDIREDFEHTMTLCRPVDLEAVRSIPAHVRLFRIFLRVFAPLL